MGARAVKPPDSEETLKVLCKELTHGLHQRKWHLVVCPKGNVFSLLEKQLWSREGGTIISSNKQRKGIIFLQSPAPTSCPQSILLTRSQPMTKMCVVL